MSVSYDDRTALVVVDVQNDFADPTGSLFVPGAPVAVAAVNREVESAAAAGALVVYTQDWHPSTTPHFAKDGGVWPVHCVAGTWGAELHPTLRVVNEAPVVRKGTTGADGYSGFSERDPLDAEAITETELAELLRSHGIERLVVVGLATDYCVRETALDAVELGFVTTVLADAVAAVDRQPGDGYEALADMSEAGVIVL